MKRESIKISEKAKSYLVILAKKSDKSQIDYLSKAMEYLHQTGLDVYSKSSVNVPDTLKSLENRIIGFMKKRETDFFVPMSEKMTELVRVFSHFIAIYEETDVLDIVNQSSDQKEEVQPTYTIPDESQNLGEILEEMPSVKREVDEGEKTSEILPKIDYEKERLKAEIFKDELTFLIEKINKGSGLNSDKFIAKVSTRDIERIKKILNDN